MNLYRHGDVNLVRVSAKDFAAAKARGTVLPQATSHVLAKGEATGSVHLSEDVTVAPEDWELLVPLRDEA